MSEVEQLEERIAQLAPRDLAQFRAWFLELDARIWDQQIEADAKAGKLRPSSFCASSTGTRD